MRLTRVHSGLSTIVLSAATWAALSSVMQAQSTTAQPPRSPSAVQSPQRKLEKAAHSLESAQANSARERQRKQIAELIEQLGDEHYQTRRAAELALIRIGLPAFEQLRQAMFHPNVQIDVAARYIIRSQSVTWWLDTDPLSVRQVLQDYNEQKDTDRETAMQTLANEKSPYALLALCRIARYESSERLSKFAALSLMEALIERIEPSSAKRMVNLVREAMGDSNRPSADWIAAMVDSIERQDSEVERWRELASDEYILLQKNPLDTSPVLVTRLHYTIAMHLTKRSQRAIALEIVRPCFDLVANKSKEIRAAAMWAIDAGLPELVADLAGRHKNLFESEPQLGFLLAESQLAAGQAELAESSAAAASESVMGPKIEQSALQLRLDDSVAASRESMAEFLNKRGMFDWAEKEYEKALSLDLQPRTEFRLRVGLSTLQSDGEEYAEAAETLSVLIAKIRDNPVEMDRLAKDASYDDSASDWDFVLGTFSYYSAQAAAQNHDRFSARNYYLQALKQYPANPDILIGLKQVITPEVDDTEFGQAMKENVAMFHEEIVTLERQLLGADRGARSSLEYVLATKCNQLAWLLSKTGQRPEEALQLSLRSLELSPNQAIYQDTLARCYFTLGNIDKAIETQELAIRNEPNQRGMLRQLAEFKAAKQN